MLIISLTIIASLFYVLATSHVLTRLFHQQGPSQKVTVILSTMAILAHMLLLVNSVFRSDGQDLSIVNVALLTLFDMCKAVDPNMTMTGIHVLEKRGGKTGDWQHDNR